MSNIKLAITNIRMNLKNEKELKISFIITIFGMAINNIAFLIIWYYFGKSVGELNGWRPLDIFGLNGFNAIAYGIISFCFNGIFNLPEYISTGNLDKYLLTPKNILVKVSTSKVSTSALGDMLFGITCFIIFSIYNKFNFINILFSIFLVIIASIVYYSFSLICMSVSFYLMDGSNVSNGLHGMFLSNSLYHGGAFTGVLRFIFTFLIPSLFLGTIPVELVKNFSISNFLIAISVTLIWFIIAISFFYKSLSKYESNNLFQFGS